MGVSAIKSSNAMSAMQMTSVNIKDQKSKNIQTEIEDVQQEIRKLTSDEELSVSEKAAEKKKLQKEKSSLDTELKQHQEELLRSHKREIKLAGLQEERNPEKAEDTEETKAQVQTDEGSSDETGKNTLSADETRSLHPGTVITQNSDGTVILKEVMNRSEDESDAMQSDPAVESKEEVAAVAAEESAPEEEETDTDSAHEFRPTAREMQAMVSADVSAQIADRMGTLVTKTDDGIAILKGEMKQDTARGVDTERKQAELEEMQKQKQREMAFQFSMLGDAGDAIRTATETNASAKAAQNGMERNFQVSGLHVSQDGQTAQQGFQVAIA